MTRSKRWQQFEDGDEFEFALTALRSAGHCEEVLHTLHESAGPRELDEREQQLWDAVKERGERFQRAEIAAARGYVDGPSGIGHRTANEVRSAALRHMDHHVNTGALSPEGAEIIDGVMGSGSYMERTMSQRWAMATGNPAYESAFAKILINPQRGHMLWTPAEQRAVQIVHEVRAAMSLGAGTGAELVPLTLDPTILLTNAGTANSLRKVSRVVQTSSGQWKGVSSSGATSEWLAEATEAADGSPPLDDIPIPVWKAAVDVVWSYEIEQDSAGDFLKQVRTVSQDAVDNMTALAYTTGTGTAQPKGFVTALAGTTSEINTTGTEAMVATDPFALQNALGARFSANASFQSHIGTANALRAFETSNGALYWPELRNNPPALAGKPWHENSHMKSSTAVNPAVTANNYVLAYGDWKHFVIVDQIGALFEIIPGLGANRRPTAQRHGFLTFRTGSDVTMKEAFRLLDIPTTA
ncbi:phage major capsid protein [Streptomyces abyssalis]|uniref:phage major capsid protein n=1 Tax=Streptomyces abyssalis TaxID=933944 RepID=UPI00085C1988|nr:phage major capsid protein [Streptomyces abyssalis]